MAKTVYPFDRVVRQSLNIPEDEVIYHGYGCENCNKTGVVGRMAVYELWCVDGHNKIRRCHGRYSSIGISFRYDTFDR